jgi:hypothetical protein
MEGQKVLLVEFPINLKQEYPAMSANVKKKKKKSVVYNGLGGIRWTLSALMFSVVCGWDYIVTSLTG